MTHPQRLDSGPAARLRHVATLVITGRPATFATRGEADWKAAVRAATAAAGLPPTTGRFGLRIEFRLPTPDRAGQTWDLDNLLKPTIDALADVVGRRPIGGRPQADDERVDYVEAWKRTDPSDVGATIEVHLIDPPSNPRD